MNWSINQEIWRSNNAQYARTPEDLLAPNADYYGFTLPTRTATTYTLTATATDDQLNDKAKNGTTCSPLTLDHRGVKTPAECWD